MIIMLSQFLERPAKEHYQAVKAVFVYLWHTKSNGLYYWQPSPHDDLPDEPLPKAITNPEQIKEFLDFEDPLITKGISAST
jgi:hypothetical protein